MERLLDPRGADLREGSKDANPGSAKDKQKASSDLSDEAFPLQRR